MRCIAAVWCGADQFKVSRIGLGRGEVGWGTTGCGRVRCGQVLIFSVHKPQANTHLARLRVAGASFDDDPQTTRRSSILPSAPLAAKGARSPPPIRQAPRVGFRILLGILAEPPKLDRKKGSKTRPLLVQILVIDMSQRCVLSYENNAQHEERYSMAPIGRSHTALTGQPAK